MYICWSWTLEGAACTIPLPETKAVLATIGWTVAGEEGGGKESEEWDGGGV